MLTELLMVVTLHGDPVSQLSFSYNSEMSCQIASQDLSFTAATGYAVESTCRQQQQDNLPKMSGEGTAVITMAFEGTQNIGGYQIGAITSTHLQCVKQTTEAQEFFNMSERSWVSICLPRVI